MAENEDLDWDDEEGMEPSDDSEEFEAPGTGPVGADEEDEADAEAFSDDNAPADDEINEVLEPFDAARQEVLDSYDTTLKQAPPEVESTDASHEARIDYDPDASDDPEVAEAELTERYQQQKADAELAEHRAFIQAELARQKAAREAREAPPVEALQAPEPNPMADLDSESFDRLLQARDEGLDYIPPKQEVDLAALYGQFMPRSEPESEDY